MWNKSRSVPESLRILGDIAFQLSSRGPLSQSIYDLVRESRFADVVDFTFDYNALDAIDISIVDLMAARQIHALYSKLECLDIGCDKAATASRTFVDAERSCRLANKRFTHQRSSHEDFSKDMSSDVHAVLYRAARKIATILGDVPSLSELPAAFGPGANTNVKGSLSFPRGKLGAQLQCSNEMSPTVHEFLSETPAWTDFHSSSQNDEFWYCQVGVVPGKLVFVPKNARTYRSIMVEPLLNSFFQKGVGSYIRDRLRFVGVDLRDQKRNQILARKGSIQGDLATMDLSSASDCISRELVWHLLPYEWAELLSRIRTGSVLLPEGLFTEDDFPSSSFDVASRVLRLEKHSSMGNGYTFELESLIFYALAHSCTRHQHVTTVDVSVYGDDIIIPVRAFRLLETVLECCGFSVNSKKSFFSGPFRESCGADYYKGIDIRPFYFKTEIADADLYSFHNFLYRRYEFDLASYIVSYVNQNELLFGPDGFGDGHLLSSSFELRRNRKAIRDGWSGGYFDTYALKARRFTKRLPGDSVLPTYSVYTRSGKNSPTDPDVVRGSRGYAKISIYTLGS